MVTIEFELNQIIVKIHADINEPFIDVVNRYYNKSNVEPGTVYFLANGKVLDLEGSIESKMNILNKQNKSLRIIVYSVNQIKKLDKIYRSKDIICPKCHESCKIQIKNGKFKLYECINAHISDNIKINDFSNTQMINMYDIICINHKDRNMAISYNNEFYICLTCKKIICLLCAKNHDESHSIVKYQQRNYICPKHNSNFIKYCKICKLDICIVCIEDHEDHDGIYFGEITPKKGEIKDKLSEFKSEIDLFNNDININT